MASEAEGMVEMTEAMGANSANGFHQNVSLKMAGVAMGISGLNQNGANSVNRSSENGAYSGFGGHLGGVLQTNGLCPTSVAFSDVAGLQGALLGEAAGAVVVLFASASSIARFGLSDTLEAMRSRYSLFHIDEIENNPSVEALAKVLLRYKRDLSFDSTALATKCVHKAPEAIFAIGGGSAIDSAKIFLALKGLDLVGVESSLKNIKAAIVRAVEAGYYCKELGNKASGSAMSDATTKECAQGIGFANSAGGIASKLLVVPTTSGSGSEVTPFATLWDKDRGVKLSVASANLAPNLALLVPELLAKMPLKLTATTALDALSHLVESFWARASNPLIRAIARGAFITLRDSLPLLLEDLGSLELRARLAGSATLGGICIRSTKTTACHSISYPLTLGFNIPHGIACAATLGGVLEYNLKIDSTLSELNEIFSNFGGLSGFVRAMARQAGISLALSDYGVSRASLEEISRASFTKGRMDNNPYPLEEVEIKTILENIL